jgi:diacylglycerol kinase
MTPNNQTDQVPRGYRWRTRGFKGDLKAVGHAYAGIQYMVLHERAFRLQMALIAMYVVAAACRSIGTDRWIVSIMWITLILAAETLNTAIERLCDHVHPDFNQTIGLIKNLCAGVVLVVCLGATITGVIFLL